MPAQTHSTSANGRRPACPPPILYTPGSAVAGEFNVEDCSTTETGTKQVVDFYGIRLDGRSDIFAVLEAPGLNVRLTLMNEDGVEVAKDGYIGAFTFISTQLPAGLYLLQLVSEGGAPDNRVYGRYSLRSSTNSIGFEGCPQIDTIQPTATVTGEWSVEDCIHAVNTRWDLHRFDYYRLRIPTRRDVTLELASPGINSLLTLFSADGAPLGGAESFGTPGVFSTQLAPGEYVVRVGVASYSPRETGSYTLRVR